MAEIFRTKTSREFLKREFAMKWLQVLGAISIIAANPLIALAEKLPDIRPGLWEVNIEVDGKPEGKMKQCIDDKTISEILNTGTQVMGKRCSSPDIKKSGNEYKSSVSCNLALSTMSSSSVLKGDFEESYTIDSVTTFTPPLMGQSKSVSKSKAAWEGECPEGMNPGDIITPDGRKINPKEMLSQLPDMGSLLDAAGSGNMDEIMKKLPQLQEMQRKMRQD
ncbi:MAG TPA: hypothetical protein PKA63_02870 [Oligoflexia bacterium]|nr:hypothetical protein [Oligoflexia bacterium]HMP47596.1 hypothetical protein [Oligoflexia bacterium]